MYVWSCISSWIRFSSITFQRLFLAIRKAFAISSPKLIFWSLASSWAAQNIKKTILSCCLFHKNMIIEHKDTNQIINIRLKMLIIVIQFASNFSRKNLLPSTSVSILTSTTISTCMNMIWEEQEKKHIKIIWNTQVTRELQNSTDHKITFCAVLLLFHVYAAFMWQYTGLKKSHIRTILAMEETKNEIIPLLQC